MNLDTFLREYRDYMSATSIISNYYPDSLTNHQRYVIDKDSIRKLEELEVNFQYLESNVDNIKDEINKLFDNIDKKLDRLSEVAEGFQKINTKEITDTSIKHFNMYTISDRTNYDTYLDAITLPRNTVTRSLKAKVIEKEYKGAIERYRIPSGKVEIIAKVIVLDKSNTLLNRIVCVSRDGTELLSTSDLIFDVPIETYEILVITDNIDKDVLSYTSIDILSNTFGSQATLSFEDKLTKKEGKLLKLVIGKDVPTDCYITGILNIRYEDVNESVYFNLGYGRVVLVPYEQSKGEVKDLYGNKVLESSIEAKDLVLSEEYSTDESIIKYKGNGVFDISGIKSKEFILGLSFSLYSINNKTKTPQIKNVFSYITE